MECSIILRGDERAELFLQRYVAYLCLRHHYDVEIKDGVLYFNV